MRTPLILGLSLALFACSKSDKKAEPEPKPETKPEPAPEAKRPPPPPADDTTAPDFSLNDLDGNEVTLSSFRGKTIVLEWFNPGCPFVKYSHGEGPLKDLAAKHIADGVVWLAINSGAPGKQGHGVEANKSAAKTWGMSYPILLDEDGTVGKLYGAKTTPHMFVIDPNGKLVYRGALDNAPLGRVEGDALVNYVDIVLAALADGRDPQVAEQKSYGCSVKYAD